MKIQQRNTLKYLLTILKLKYFKLFWLILLPDPRDQPVVDQDGNLYGQNYEQLYEQLLVI